MNKPLLFTILAIVLVFVIGGIYLVNSSFNKSSSQNPGITGATVSDGNTKNQDSQSKNLSGETTPEAGKTYTIDIVNFAFSPSTLIISKGDRVVWTNKDSVRHTVTSNSGVELNSNTLSKGQTYSHKFDSAGEFTYHCTPHQSMQGRIIVK